MKHISGWLVLAALCAAGGQPLWGQDVTPAGTSQRLSRHLETTEGYIKKENWTAACCFVQHVLLQEKDDGVTWTRIGPDGKPVVVSQTAHEAASCLLRDMPAR